MLKIIISSLILSLTLIKGQSDVTPICSRSDECNTNNWRYIVYFPNTFRTGFTEKIAISTYGFPNKVNVNVTLIDRERLFSSQEYVVEPGVLTELDYYIPFNTPNRVFIRINGSGTTDDGQQWIFTNTTKNPITVSRMGINILIQTDRPIYKPGQTILGRVIVVDSKLLPVEGTLDNVIIESPSGSRMRQFTNVTLEDGIFSFDLNLSTKPLLGKWKIKAEMLSQEKRIDVEIKKYVLPKFEVKINPPSFISYLTKKIEFEVCAKYSYGKPVYGRLEVQACTKDKFSPESKCAKYDNVPIYGCRTVRFSTDYFDMEKFYKGYGSIVMQMNAKVKEDATSVTRKADQEVVDIQKNEVQLSFESKDSFKPGIPFKVMLFAKYPDQTPIPKLKVNISMGTRGFSSDDLIGEKTVEIINGMYEIETPVIPFDAENINLKAQHDREEAYPQEPSFNRESFAFSTINPWYSASHNYIQIERVKAPVMRDTEVNLMVSFTSSFQENTTKEIHYSMMCAGNIAQTGVLMYDFTTDFVFENEDGNNSNIDGIMIQSPEPPPTTIMTMMNNTSGEEISTTQKLSEEDVEIKTSSMPNSNDEDVPVLIVDPVPDPRIPEIFPPFPIFTTPTRPPFPKTFSRGQFSIPIKITSTMSPKCRIVVYYVHEDEIIADSIELDVIIESQNKVSISFSDDQYAPGKTMKIQLRGSPNSRVAMAAIDKSIQFLAEGNDIKQKDIKRIRDDLDIGPGFVNNFDRCPFPFKRKRRSSFPYYSGSDYVDSEKAFADIGVQVLTNLRLDPRPCQNNFGPVALKILNDPFEQTLLGVPPNQASARPRTNFPETWIWEDFKLSEDGTKTITKTVPDTITSWYLSGFGISKNDGLGIASSQELRAFQPFFISLNLPYSVIRGEDVVIPTAVFNYMDNSCITVRVTLASSSDFEVISGPKASSCISASGSMTALFRIRPMKLGRIPLRLSAETIDENLCESQCKLNKSVSMSDIVVRKLLVEPEGLKEDYTISNFFCPKDSKDGKFKTEIQLDTPDDLVPGSLFTKAMTIGDIMGPSLSDIDKLLAMPFGCGEQNMLKFAPNIYILNYLNSTNQMTPEIKKKALDFMRTGYQRELTYKRRDGSYSAFGESDEEGSTWLTAFVLKSYSEANMWIDIDKKELIDPMMWLLNQQDASGCFKKVGELHHKAMAGGVRTPVTLTAYILTALMEAGLDENGEKAQLAASCVNEFIEEVKDSYSLAIIANMYSKMTDNPDNLYDTVMKKLFAMAIEEDGIIHFEESKSKERENKRRPSYFYQARSTDIEQTAYALLSILNRDGKGGVTSAVPIVRWLSKQRNGLGGWSSTQDTILALEALSNFASFTYDPALDMKIRISDDANFSYVFDLNNQNNLVLQSVEDVPVPSNLTINAEGNGCALVQVFVSYNIQKDEKEPSFSIEYSMKSINSTLYELKSCYSQMLQICVSWLGEEKSNMALLEVEMVSGFIPNEDIFEQLQQEVKGLKDIEVQDNKAVFYFDKLDDSKRCVNLQVDQTSVVRETKPAAMRVYDYYDKDDSAVTMYGFSTEQCTTMNLE